MSYRESEIIKVMNKCDCDAMQIMLMSYLDPNQRSPCGSHQLLDNMLRGSKNYIDVSLLGAAVLYAINEETKFEQRLNMIHLIIESGASIDNLANQIFDEQGNVRGDIPTSLTEFLYNECKPYIEDVANYARHMGVYVSQPFVERKIAPRIHNIERLFTDLASAGYINTIQLAELNEKITNEITETEHLALSPKMEYLNKKTEYLKEFSTHLSNIINAHENLNAKPSEEVWFDYEI